MHPTGPPSDNERRCMRMVRTYDTQIDYEEAQIVACRDILRMTRNAGKVVELIS